MKRTVSLHKGNFRAGGTEITNTKTKSSPDALKNGSDGKFDVTDILPQLKKHNTRSPVLITKSFLFHTMWQTNVENSARAPPLVSLFLWLWTTHGLWSPFPLPGSHYDNLKSYTNRDHFFMKLLSERSPASSPEGSRAESIRKNPILVPELLKTSVAFANCLSSSGLESLTCKMQGTDQGNL